MCIASLCCYVVLGRHPSLFVVCWQIYVFIGCQRCPVIKVWKCWNLAMVVQLLLHLHLDFFLFTDQIINLTQVLICWSLHLFEERLCVKHLVYNSVASSLLLGFDFSTVMYFIYWVHVLNLLRKSNAVLHERIYFFNQIMFLLLGSKLLSLPTLGIILIVAVGLG
jgi:hypothetical protein